MTIPVNQSIIDTAIFTPNSFGASSEIITIYSNSPGSPNTITVKGNSPAPTIKSIESSIAFGTVPIGTTKRSTINVVNNSVNTLILNSIYTNTAAFAVTPVNGSAGADTLKVVVSFTPTAYANYIDTLYLRNNSATSLLKIPLSGNGALTGVQERTAEIPTIYSLAQNYPNPFNPSTTIQYGLPARSSVRLVIYNILGQVVKELGNTEQSAGWNQIVWDANVSSGLYFCRLEATSKNDPSKRFVETKKMLLLK